MNFGYLEDGTLIQVGTLIRQDNEIREVVRFKYLGSRMVYSRIVHNFIVAANVPGDVSENEVEFHNLDLEEMKRDGAIKIYN